MIHLDSNIMIALLTGRSPRARGRFETARSHGELFVVSSIVYHELMFGAAASNRRQANEEGIASFLAAGQIMIEPFTDADARIAADIRADLRRAGALIGPYDLLIAAHALRARALLVTANTREFARVAGLNVIDWTL